MLVIALIRRTPPITIPEFVRRKRVNVEGVTPTKIDDQDYSLVSGKPIGYDQIGDVSMSMRKVGVIGGSMYKRC